MDRREILVLKPNVATHRIRSDRPKFQPMLGRRLLCRLYVSKEKAIIYAIAVKQRYLKLKEHECTNPPTT